MKAEVIAIGSELTSGQKLDTNSQWLSQRLGEVGVEVRFHTTLADDMGENVDALRMARSRAQLVIISGGLGPTQDDLTREALATMAGVPLIENEECLQALTAFFERRNREMAPRNRVQALLPDGARPLPNRTGTAPGVWFEFEGVLFAAVPGVPSEMKVMVEEQLIPRLRESGKLGSVRCYRVINMFGRGESEIEADALDLTARGREPEVGITASDATISFRISAEGATEADAWAATEPTARLIYERFGDLILGEGDVDVVQALILELQKHQATLAVAESCTGGLVAQRLTDYPGVSQVFLGGVVCYGNQAKIDLVGVPSQLIEQHGAVSAEVAEALAVGARDRFGASLGIGITGIAGPDGGTPEKPVGLVYVALANQKLVAHRRLLLGQEQPRKIIRSRAAKHAMNWAWLILKSDGV